IEQPEAATTSISYNAANLPTAITQGGVTETRRYNNKMEMCVQKRPDTGLKVFTYNVLGQIDRYYDGVLGNGTHCSDYTHLQSAVVQHYYDNYGDLSGRGFGDGTATISQTYDGNGNLLSTSGAGGGWSYQYNSLN
ncbi:hypothetical protein, partial [Enterobacter cloacae complex sp. 742-ADZ3-9B]|uniref:hypothetical protein n=1 Tax=Enterobacter cloacae complex sp. 742-ADZ3-9B TaxID=2511992 RepID=UPI00155EE270